MTNAQKEELRSIILGWMADRSALAFAVHSIHRGASREMPVTVAEVEAAAEFLKDLGHLKIVPNPLGATRHYQITAAGTIAHEGGA